MKTLLLTLLAAVFAISLAVPASATCGVAGVPCGTQQFTAQTQYMSMQGYLRWKEFQDHHAWIPPDQSVRLAKEQQQICTPKG